jgi:hypothetical protein
VASFQHLSRVRRKDGSEGSVSTIGGAFAHDLAGGPFYLSLQAHSAFAGGAGAYSVGLIGAGVATSRDPAAWRAGGETLIGAAGGGGIETQGGALVQGLAWVGVPAGRSSQLRLGAGIARSLHGGSSSPVIQVSWSHAFGLAQR